MSDAFGFGGNSFTWSGQITMDGTNKQIPLPGSTSASPNSQNLIPGTAVLHLTAGATDVYIGPNTAANPLSITTGRRIPANICAPPITTKESQWAVGASGVLTYLWEYN